MQYVPNVPQPRRTLAVPLMAAAVLGAGIATATFAIVNIEDQPIVSLPTPAEESTAVPSDAVAGQRADGGPEEGTAQAITVVPAASATSGAATRYDGGPNEGTAQSITAQPSAAAAATRYDGGPEEGTRGATTESSSGGSSGPVPFSGMRP
jgi:hypothetical protein